MFSKILTGASTHGCSAQIERLKTALQECDAVVIGAGAGLSTSAGFDYTGERFEKYFSDFAGKYGIHDLSDYHQGRIAGIVVYKTKSGVDRITVIVL